MAFLPDLIPQYGWDPESKELDPMGDDRRWMDYSQQVKYWANAAWEEARYENQQSEEVREMQKAMDYLVGKQWPSQRPTYKSKPINNRIWRLWWELVATLTDIRPLFDIKALRSSYDPQAEILNKCTRSWWLEADGDLKLAKIICYGLLCTGYAKIEWNPRLRNGEGDFDLITLSPEHVLPLKVREELDDAQAVIMAMPQPLSFFRQKFPRKGYTVKADPQFSKYAIPQGPPGHVPQMLWDSLSPGMKRVMAQSPMVGESQFPMALYREIWFQDFQLNDAARPVFMGDPRSNWGYWVKPGERLYPRGRLICMGGNEIMDDDPNPYWHGRYPFAAMRLNVVPWQWHGLSEMKSLYPLQDIINNILAGVLDMVKKAVNPGFLAPSRAFSEATWKSLDWSLPNAKAEFNPNVAHMPTWQPAPQVPSYVLTVAQMVAREMDSSSGIATVSEAVRKKQVPSADTLEQMKQSQQTPLRLKGRNIESFLRKLGTMNISNIFQFYTAERRLFMLGPDGLTFQDFDYEPGKMVPGGTRPEDHVRNFVFVIHPGSLLTINQVDKAMQLLKLRQMKDIDRRTLLEQSNVGVDPDIIEQRLEKEQLQAVELAMKAKMNVEQSAGAQARQPGAVQ